MDTYVLPGPSPMNRETPLGQVVGLHEQPVGTLVAVQVHAAGVERWVSAGECGL